MKILIPIKRVPDPYGRVRLNADGRIDTDDIKWVVNPFDEIAIEEAVRMREAGHDVEIVVVTIGGAECEEQIRAALAMGADRGILVLDTEPLDPGAISHLLAAVCRGESPDIVLAGKQAIDDDYSQTGPMLAAKLGWPQAAFASKVIVEGQTVVVTREVDAGRETIRVALPAVITTDLRLNEPRYVALPAIIRARAKPVRKVSSADLGGRPAAQVVVVGLEPPASRKAGRTVESVEALLTALREEARVL